MPEAESKACTKCGEVKALDAFYFEKGKPRGCCKDCHKAKVYERRTADPTGFREYQRQWANANRERVNKQQRERRTANADAINAAIRLDRKANPEKYREQERKRNGDPRHLAVRRARYSRQREQINAAVRARRAADPEKWRERDRRASSRPENRAKQRRYNRRYYKANRERWTILRQNYIARKNSVPNEPYTRREIWKRDEGVCKGCGVNLPYKPGAFHIDHIVPLSKGGPNTPRNVQLLCPKCNREKWARTDWVPPRPALF